MYERKFDIAYNGTRMRVTELGCVEHEFELGFTKNKLVSVKKINSSIIEEDIQTTSQNVVQKIVSKIGAQRIAGTGMALAGLAVSLITGCLDAGLFFTIIGLVLTFSS